MKARITIALAACVLAGTAGATRQPTLTGHLRVAATEPTCLADGCGMPLISYTLAFRRAGKTHLVRTLPKTGAFRAVLAPGRYVITVREMPDATIVPARVLVRRATTTRLVLMLRAPRPLAP